MDTTTSSGARRAMPLAWLTRSPLALARLHARALALGAGKRVLGAGTYRAVREALLSRGGGA